MVDGVARGFFDIAKNRSFLDPEEEKYSNMPTDWSRLDPQNPDLGYWDYRSRMGQLGTIVEENPAAQPDTSDNVSNYKTFDSSLGADLSQGHGVASDPYRQQALIDSSLAAKHQDRGMELIRSALYKGPTADEQSNATMMKIAPSLGGAILGAIIGSPKLSPHSKFTLDELNKNPTGISGGLQIGNLYGEKDSQEYLAKLKAAGEADAAENQMLAKSELSQADDAQKEASILTREGLKADTDMQLEGVKEAARQAAVKETDMQLVNQELANNPDARQAFTNIVSGNPSQGDYQKLSPAAIKVAQQGLRSSVQSQKQDMQQNQLGISGYAKIDGTLPTQTEKNNIEAQNAGNAKTKALLATYIENPDSMVGQESAIQGAVSGMLMNAQRQATGSGANFSESEQKMIQRSLPAIIAGNPVLAAEQAGFGRDQKAFAQALIGLYDKVQDYALMEGYGLKRNDLDLSYYPQTMVKKIIPSYQAPQVVSPASGVVANPEPDPRKFKDYPSYKEALRLYKSSGVTNGG